jgi:RNA polymerase sigma-32 factor
MLQTKLRQTPRRVRELLSLEDETLLIQRWRDHGCLRSREQLIRAHEHLIRGIVARVCKADWRREQREDLLQVARIELIEALEKYEDGHDARFATFAAYQVRGVVSRWIMDNSGPTRVGTNIVDKHVFNRFARERSRIEKATSKPLDDEGRSELARAIKVPLKAVLRMEPRIRRQDISFQHGFSTGSSFDNGDAGDALENRNAVMREFVQPSPEDDVASRHVVEKVGRLVSQAMDTAASLTDRERHVLSLRHLADIPLNMAKIGEDLGITKERVRQIERSATKKLRAFIEKHGFTRASFLAA